MIIVTSRSTITCPRAFGKIPIDFPHWRNVVTSLVLSILNGSSSYLHTIRTVIKAWMSLNLVKIPSHILALAPLEHLKN